LRTFLLRRLLSLIPLLMGVTLLAFLLIYLAPGDFLSQMAENPTIRPETIEAMRHKFGLDQPWFVQYFLWLKNVFLHLDFGESFAYRQPVFSVIIPRLGNTLILAVAAAIVAWGIADPARHPGGGAAVLVGRQVGVAVRLHRLSIPELFFALLMMYFAATSGWFPVGGMRSLDFADLSFGGKLLDLAHHLVLPAIVLGTVPTAGRMRQMRANLLDVLRLDYVTTARAKGLDENTVVFKHARAQRHQSADHALRLHHRIALVGLVHRRDRDGLAGARQPDARGAAQAGPLPGHGLGRDRRHHARPRQPDRRRAARVADPRIKYN
jgi:peptide/nickel transport system permease protein